MKIWDNVTFGQILRDLRQRMSLSTIIVAGLIGLPQSTYYKYETGRRTPRDQSLLLRKTASISVDHGVDIIEVFSRYKTKKRTNRSKYDTDTPNEYLDTIAREILAKSQPEDLSTPTVIDASTDTEQLPADIQRFMDSAISESMPHIPLLPIERKTHASFSWLIDSSKLITVQRPISLSQSRRIYALKVVITSMQPRFELNETLLVDPDAAITPGDDCILFRTVNGRTFSQIIRLKSVGPLLIRAQQFSTYPASFVVPLKHATMHRILSISDLL